MRHIPQPTEYLDPLSDIDDCYYYAVPKFFDYGHPNTRWLVCMIMHNRSEKVVRKMELTPRLFCDAYYQLVDDPRVYWGQKCNERSVFHRQAVLYFTTTAAAIYLGQESFVEVMLQYRDTYNAPMHSVHSVQYATHVQDTQNGDLHAFPMCTVMLRCCKFPCALPMLRQGWDPLLPMAMPLRRRHERRARYFVDWLDYALWLVSERPTYPLSALVLGLARDPILWRHGRQPLAQMLAREAEGGGGGGLIDVEDLPAGGPRMVGVRTLAELVKDYGRYQQARLLHMDMQRQVRRAEALGIDRERLLAQSLDYSAAFLVPPSASQPQSPSPTPAKKGSNNNAQRMQPTNQEEMHYASEPLRILHYMLRRDRHGKSIRQCLDAVEVYLKRNFYLTAAPMDARSARLRDSRNAVVLLLNLVQRQFAELKRIASLSSAAVNPRGDGAKNLSKSHRQACLRNANKLVQLLTRVLLHSKEFAYFVLMGDTFPPYPPAEVDFAYAEDLAQNYADIRLGVAREFNADEQSCRHLTLQMLQELQSGRTVMAGALHLRLKLGQPPPPPAVVETAESQGSKTKCCRRTESKESDSKKKKAKRGRNCCNSSSMVGTNADWRLSSPRITFVRVHRILPHPQNRSLNDASPTAAPTTSDAVDDIDQDPVAGPTPGRFEQHSEEAKADTEQLPQISDGAADADASDAADGHADASEAVSTGPRGRSRCTGGFKRWLAGLRWQAWRRVKGGERKE